ncbi:hypothetical protein [Aurantivibrio infirmus]
MRAIIILSVLLLTGCPLLHIGHIENNSNKEITIMNPWHREQLWHIEPGLNGEVIWNKQCLVIAEGEIERYFALNNVPDEIYQVESRFSSNIHIYGKFQSGNLILQSKSGSSFIISPSKECPNA